MNGGEKIKERTQTKNDRHYEVGGKKNVNDLKDVSRPGGAARLHMSLASTECPNNVSFDDQFIKLIVED